MSGGAFEYSQYKIGYIADQIEETVIKNGVEKTPEEIKNTRRICSITNIRMRLLRK